MLGKEQNAHIADKVIAAARARKQASKKHSLTQGFVPGDLKRHKQTRNYRLRKHLELCATLDDFSQGDQIVLPSRRSAITTFHKMFTDPASPPHDQVLWLMTAAELEQRGLEIENFINNS